MAYNTKRAISPIIATILLIVMTVSIAAFTFIWMQGFMTNVQQQAEQQVTSTMQQPVFAVPYATFTNPNTNKEVRFVIANQGNLPIDLTKATFSLEEYTRSDNLLNNSWVLAYNGTTVSCDDTDLQFGEQTTCTATFDSTPTDLTNNYYIFSVTYRNVRQSYTIR